jgi:uncharacterized protein (TIGR02246 family)
MRKNVCLIAVMQCVLCFAPGAVAHAQTRDDEVEIRRLIDALTTAFNARDDAGTLAVATADADFVTVNGKWTKGKEYTTSRRVRFGTALKNASIRPMEAKIRFLRPDIALAHVTHEMRGMLDASGKELPPHPELNLRVFVKENGKWLMAAFHNTGVATPAAPPHK